nr:hypothetical protein [Candidatus Electrothrix aestuarii]
MKPTSILTFKFFKILIDSIFISIVDFLPYLLSWLGDPDSMPTNISLNPADTNFFNKLFLLCFVMSHDFVDIKKKDC